MQNEQGKSGLQFRADARPANIDWKLAAVGITDLLAMGLRQNKTNRIETIFMGLESQTYLRWD